MNALQFPCTIFRTQRRMDDYSARDMRHGDLSEIQLVHQFQLKNISPKVNPYRLKRTLPFTPSQYVFGQLYRFEESITLAQCASILFDEFRNESRTLAIFGPYRHLIVHMINHMQYQNGSPFRHILLDQALNENIISNNTNNSTLKIIKDILLVNIDWQTGTYPEKYQPYFRDAILGGRLPKFTSLKDNFNGLGIAIHDTWATHITIKSLQVIKNSYRAIIQYQIQDHFGLDDTDMVKYQTKPHPIFKIWFVLQRYQKLGYKPFITNMQANIVITGNRLEA